VFLICGRELEFYGTGQELLGHTHASIAKQLMFAVVGNQVSV
jgi:hypothetical protein